MDIILIVLATIGALASIYVAFLKIQERYLGPTYRDALKMARKVLARVKKEQNWEPSLVLGIGRSGGIWGGWLAGNLGSKPLLVVDVSYKQSPPEFPGGKQVLSALEEFEELGNRILLVEGAAGRNQTFRCFIERFSDQLSSWEIKTAVLYRNPVVPKKDIDFYGRILEPWPEKLAWHEQPDYQPHMRNGSNSEP